MTIRKRLARSNIAMLVIPILAAALLLLLGLGAALLLLRGNLITLHDVVEQIETVLHGFKLTLSAFAAVAVLLMLAAVALTDLYLTRHLFRHISQPLDTLTAGVARIRDGDLDTPIGYTEADEFKAACDAVDEMAARLKASLEQQAAQQQKQELIAGMSHDLKSPLTAIRAYTEGLLEGGAQDEATRQRYLQTIYAKETDMETLVNRLFAFAKMDVSAYPVRLEPLALRPALETVAEEQEGVAVTVDVPDMMVLEQSFDLLLDLMLPGMDGFTICRKVREVKDIPILMVTALGEDVDKIRGLGYGADDYIEKPFSPSVLVARVKAHLAQYRRLKPSPAAKTTELTMGPLAADTACHRITKNGAEVPLKNKEYELLLFLMRHPGQVFSREDLYEMIWGWNLWATTSPWRCI